MKKLNLQFLLLMIICSGIVIGCEEDDPWHEVELQNTSCYSNLTTVRIYSNTTGTVTSLGGTGENPVYIRIATPDTAQVTEYCLPCNLPDEFKIENLQIRFNGELKSMAGDFHDPDNEVLVIAQPLTLTRMWVGN